MQDVGAVGLVVSLAELELVAAIAALDIVVTLTYVSSSGSFAPAA